MHHAYSYSKTYQSQLFCEMLRLYHLLINVTYPDNKAYVTLVQIRVLCVHDLFNDTGGRLCKTSNLLTSGDNVFIVGCALRGLTC